MKCPECGGEVEELYIAEPIAFLRCTACGRRLEILRTPAPAADHGGHKRLRVWVPWKGEAPDAHEIITLRKLAPELADLSLGEIKRRLSGLRVWDFGVMWDVEARELVLRGRELGLPVVVEMEAPEQ